MNKGQHNSLNRDIQVVRLLDRNAAITSTIPAFEDDFNQYKLTVNAIQIKANKQRAPLPEFVDAKNVAREALTIKTSKVNSGLKLLGMKTNNSELVGLAITSESKLDGMRDEDFKNYCVDIDARLTANAAALIPYGITELKRTEYHTLVGTYESKLDELGGGEAGRKAATTTLPNLFTEANAIREKIENYVNLLDDDHPDFGAEFNAVNIVKDLGIRHNGEEEEEPVPEPVPVPAP